MQDCYAQGVDPLVRETLHSTEADSHPQIAEQVEQMKAAYARGEDPLEEAAAEREPPTPPMRRTGRTKS